METFETREIEVLYQDPNTVIRKLCEQGCEQREGYIPVYNALDFIRLGFPEQSEYTVQDDALLNVPTVQPTSASQIRSVLKRIINDCCSIGDMTLIDSLWNEPFTGIHFRFDSVKLLYLLMETEKTFSLRISPMQLLDYGINSPEKLEETIQSLMEQNV